MLPPWFRPLPQPKKTFPRGDNNSTDGFEKEAETNSLRNGGGLCRREAFHLLFPMRASSPIRARRFTLTGFSEDEKKTEKGGRS